MAFERSLFARWRLNASPLADRLARVPVLGPFLRMVGNRLLPRGALVWTEIEEGAARGLWILVDARTGSDQRRGDREPAVQEAVRNALAAGKVFYDLGANVGFFSLLASRQVWPGGRVTAFEPDPEIAERLRLAVERNRLPNVVVVEAAVCSQKGLIGFERSPATSPDRGLGHVADAGEGTERVWVRATTLDEYTMSAPPPDLIKCDVEGAEVEVFRGAANLLSRHRPKVICEVHSPANLQAIRALFTQNGYRVNLLETEERFPVHIVAEADP